MKQSSVEPGKHAPSRLQTPTYMHAASMQHHVEDLSNVCNAGLGLVPSSRRSQQGLKRHVLQTRYTPLAPALVGIDMDDEERDALLATETARWMSHLTGVLASRPTTAIISSSATIAEAEILDSSKDVAASPRAGTLLSPFATAASYHRPIPLLASSASAPQLLRPVNAILSMARAEASVEASLKLDHQPPNYETPLGLSAAGASKDTSSRQHAVDAFEDRNQRYIAIAEKTLALANRKPHLDVHHRRFRCLHREIFANRFVDGNDPEALSPRPGPRNHTLNRRLCGARYGNTGGSNTLAPWSASTLSSMSSTSSLYPRTADGSWCPSLSVYNGQ